MNILLNDDERIVPLAHVMSFKASQNCSVCIAGASA